MDFRPAHVPDPCYFDPQILPHLIVKEQFPKNSCQLIDAGKEDWDKVEPLYNLAKVAGFDIGKIEVIVNKTFSEGFNYRLKILEGRSHERAFTPTWAEESTCAEERLMRQEVNDHLNQNPSTQIPGTFNRVKVIPMFLGTKRTFFPLFFVVILPLYRPLMRVFLVQAFIIPALRPMPLNMLNQIGAVKALFYSIGSALPQLTLSFIIPRFTTIIGKNSRWTSKKSIGST